MCNRIHHITSYEQFYTVSITHASKTFTHILVISQLTHTPPSKSSVIYKAIITKKYLIKKYYASGLLVIGYPPLQRVATLLVSVIRANHL